MKQEYIDLLKETLQQYGVDFDGKSIINNTGRKFIEVKADRGRFYYEYSEIRLSVASSPITKAGIEKFVESYWHWSKKMRSGFNKKDLRKFAKWCNEFKSSSSNPNYFNNVDFLNGLSKGWYTFTNLYTKSTCNKG